MQRHKGMLEINKSYISITMVKMLMRACDNGEEIPTVKLKCVFDEMTAKNTV